MFKKYYVYTLYYRNKKTGFVGYGYLIHKEPGILSYRYVCATFAESFGDEKMFDIRATVINVIKLNRKEFFRYIAELEDENEKLVKDNSDE